SWPRKGRARARRRDHWRKPPEGRQWGRLPAWGGGGVRLPPPPSWCLYPAASRFLPCSWLHLPSGPWPAGDCLRDRRPDVDTSAGGARGRADRKGLVGNAWRGPYDPRWCRRPRASRYLPAIASSTGETAPLVPGRRRAHFYALRPPGPAVLWPAGRPCPLAAFDRPRRLHSSGDRTPVVVGGALSGRRRRHTLFSQRDPCAGGAARGY